MKLLKTYVIGVHVMWYEIEMFPEYIESCIQMAQSIENPENITFHFCFNYQEYFEKSETGFNPIIERFDEQIDRLIGRGVIVEESKTSDDPFYNIASYRRDLNYNYCDKVDYVLWGETDSIWPGQTLHVIERIAEQTLTYPKHIISFAYRKNWDKSWERVTHPMFRDVEYVDDESWTLNNEASEKSYMSIDRMNEINTVSFANISVESFTEPKADGSCLVISSELIKAGVNIPHALLHCGEDESFMRMAKWLMGDQFIQFHVSNILRVHNRRHPKKRTGIKNEENPMGFCDNRKGDWWSKLEGYSKYNLDNLRTQNGFYTIDAVLRHAPIVFVNMQITNTDGELLTHKFKK